MKTAVLALYKVYPPEAGGAAVSLGFAEHLGGDVTLFQLSDEAGRLELRPGLAVISIPMAGTSRADKAAGLRAALTAIGREVVEADPRLAIIEGSSWAVYHWLLFKTLRRARPGLPVVYHMHNVDSLLRRQHHGPVIAWATRLAEGRMVRRSGLVTACSPADAERVSTLFGRSPGLLPNGVDIGRFAPVRPEELSRVRDAYSIRRPCVLFMGLPDYPPNREGLAFLCEDVLPRLEALVPGIRLVVIGGRVSRRAPWLVNPGRVPFEDIPAVLQACDACAAPIFSGSGTRIKILEAMAAGTPVVSTPKGLEGIDAVPGVHAETAGDGPAFAASVASLVADPAKSRSMGEAGRRLVEGRYAWPVLVRAFWKDVAESGLPAGDIAKIPELPVSEPD